jgi:hypothetical protein
VPNRRALVYDNTPVRLEIFDEFARYDSEWVNPVNTTISMAVTHGDFPQFQKS